MNEVKNKFGNIKPNPFLKTHVDATRDVAEEKSSGKIIKTTNKIVRNNQVTIYLSDEELNSLDNKVAAEDRSRTQILVRFLAEKDFFYAIENKKGE